MSDVNDDCVGKTSALWNGADIRENRNEPKRSLRFDVCDLSAVMNGLAYGLVVPKVIGNDGVFCAPLKTFLSRDSKYGFIAGHLVNAEINKQGDRYILSGSILLNDSCLIPLTEILHEGEFEITFSKAITYASCYATKPAELHVEFRWYPKIKPLTE